MLRISASLAATTTNTLDNKATIHMEEPPAVPPQTDHQPKCCTAQFQSHLVAAVRYGPGSPWTGVVPDVSAASARGGGRPSGGPLIGAGGFAPRRPPPRNRGR